jgi:hypothetical protein
MIRFSRAALAALCSGFVAVPAMAITIGGGGGQSRDCLLAFSGTFNDPAAKPNKYRCTDGDVACDNDGIVNGKCEFRVAACANSTYNAAKCSLAGVQNVTVDHALDNGDPDFDTEFQAFQTRIDSELSLPTATLDDCTNPTTLSVTVKGPLDGNVCRRNKKQVRITTLSQVLSGKLYVDKDRLKLTCDPAPAGCDPLVFYSGTYDRIQKQVFNTSCAVSGCHDSESQSGDLLLEAGASYTNTVNVNPDNGTALGAGLKRITTSSPTTGDPNTSFLFRKITNDLAPGMGSRMPLVGPALDANLIEIIRLWIEAGAPQTGWVPGTF